MGGGGVCWGGGVVLLHFMRVEGNNESGIIGALRESGGDWNYVGVEGKMRLEL